MTVHARSPRAVALSRLFANASPAEMLSELKAGFNDFKARHEEAQSNTQKVIDELYAKVAYNSLNGSAAGERSPDPAYSSAYASYIRSGIGEDGIKRLNSEGHRAQVQAAMSAGSSADGGYLAPTEWDRRVNKALTIVSPMRRIANVVPTSVRAYSTLWNTGAWGSGWVGETASRPTTASAQLAPLVFDNGEIYAMPAITQQLLDDAEFDMDQWIADEFADEFAKQEGVAFISGTGVNKPRGFLTYAPGGVSEAYHPGGALAVVPSGDAAKLTADGLVTFVYSLPSPYRQNAVWLMNSTSAAAVALMKDGQGNYLWRQSLVAGQPSTLLGYTVEIDENMPNIAANATPIAFGDFQKGYTINDRLGTRVLRDPYTSKPYVLFYATKRVGGGVADPNAIRLLKISAS